MELPGGLSAVLKLVHFLLSELSYNFFPKLKHPRSPSPSLTLPHRSYVNLDKTFCLLDDCWSIPITLLHVHSPGSLQPAFSNTWGLSAIPPSFSLHPISVHPPPISFPRNVFFAKLSRERELLLAVLIFAPGKCMWETGAGEPLEEHQVLWPFNSWYGSREWWDITAIPARGRSKQGDREPQATLGCLAETCL